MADTSSSSSSPEGIAVIGGEGFLGHAIVVALSSKYRAPSHRIVSLDLVQRHYPSKDQWTFQVCDLTSSSSLVDAFKALNVKTVFHTASPWIGAGKEVCEKVNVEGTENVIEACKSQGVKKLVYTSSASVVHDGGDLINIDERCTIPKDQKDQYNITKARADALVLAANDKDGLLTCCLRPAGIFGPGDRQNIPGYINAYKQGKHKIMMGSGENLWDWTYIDNVVHAHLLAATKLGESVHYTVFSDRTRPVAASIPRRVIPTSKNVPSTSGDQVVVQDDSIDPPLPATRNRLDQWFDLQYVPEEDKEIAYLPIAGEAYFITNGEQVPFWHWARKIWYEYAGHSKKMFGLPVDIGLAYATIENALCSLMGKESAIPKNRISLSVCKRYYNIEKARKMLGYEPVIGLDEGLKIAVKWYKDNEKDLEPLKQESKK